MAAILSQPVLSKAVERGAGTFCTGAVASLIGYRHRLEDAWALAITDTHACFGVFDGHSGPRCAAHLAKQLPPLIVGLAPPIPAPRLEEALVQLDQRFIATCTPGAGGSTASVCVVTFTAPGKYAVQIAQVGDSRVIYGRPAGGAVKTLYVTLEHKPDDPAERDRIVKAGGQIEAGRVDGKLAMSRAFGDRDYKKDGARPYLEQKVTAVPDVHGLAGQEGDLVLICSDGLLEGSVTPDEAIDFVYRHVAQGVELGQVAADLCELAVERGSKDNVTCLVAQLAAPSPGAPPGPASEFLPGPFTLPADEAFRSAYRSAAGHFGLSLDAAITARREFATQRLAALLIHYGLRETPGGPPPDYAAWGEDTLRRVLKAEGERGNGDVQALAARVRELARDKTLEPLDVRALRMELAPAPKPEQEPDPNPGAAPAEVWEEAAPGPAPPPAPTLDDGVALDIPEVDDWEELAD